MRQRRQKISLMASMLIVVALLIGVAAAGMMAPKIQQQLSPQLQNLNPLNQPETEEEQSLGVLAPIMKSLGLLPSPPPELSGESVGLSAEVGYTSTTGESVVFMESYSGVGFLSYAGVFVKPSLGQYKQLKLFDENTGKEGEVWIRPVIKVRLFNGTPEHYSFKTRVKIKVGDILLGEKEVAKVGDGTPPKIVKLSKVSVRGAVLHRIMYNQIEEARMLFKKQITLKELPETGKKPLPVAKKICFTADYVGSVKFKDDPEPVVKELKDVTLGCFDFQVKETGDFEMQVDKNVTVAPLMDVVTGAESGMGGMKPEVTTVTKTITIPFTTYVTTIGGTAQTMTSYKTLTLTKTETKWMKTTIIKKAKPVTTTVTTTVTKIVTVGGGYYQAHPGYSGIALTWPYSEFIFIGG